MPHPFDRMHSVPDYEHLLTILDDVDAIEVFNPRVAIGAFNDEAARFAAKYRIAAGAGSDSHVAQGLGSARIRMHDFDGPQEFLQSLRDAEIVTRPLLAAVRAGAEVPADAGHARLGAAREQRAAREARAARGGGRGEVAATRAQRGATTDAPPRTRSRAVKSLGVDARDR